MKRSWQLAKIVCLRYIDFAYFIRYLDVRVALTLVKTFRKLAVFLVTLGIAPALAGTATFEAQSSPTPADENSHDLFSYETTYTFDSDFHESKMGHGDSLYNGG